MAAGHEFWCGIEMDGNNWRAAQAQGGGEGGGAAAGAMDSGDWRTQLLPDSRQRIVNKIVFLFYGNSLYQICRNGRFTTYICLEEISLVFCSWA
ncbi:hypothetical protein H5410_020095 [Solanum commersonii]|uniref:Uncharacterized protein n=1 Tax=Solanum commersonii TaxID=4109 RepID=A0A9J5ZD53_SOLCO|nr:hypothetical protein H5410_020095 [Solanum commersonii]